VRPSSWGQWLEKTLKPRLLKDAVDRGQSSHAMRGERVPLRAGGVAARSVCFDSLDRSLHGTFHFHGHDRFAERRTASAIRRPIRHRPCKEGRVMAKRRHPSKRAIPRFPLRARGTRRRRDLDFRDRRRLADHQAEADENDPHEDDYRLGGQALRARVGPEGELSVLGVLGRFGGSEGGWMRRRNPLSDNKYRRWELNPHDPKVTGF